MESSAAQPPGPSALSAPGSHDQPRAPTMAQRTNFPPQILSAPAKRETPPSFPLTPRTPLLANASRRGRLVLSPRGKKGIKRGSRDQTPAGTRTQPRVPGVSLRRQLFPGRGRGSGSASGERSAEVLHPNQDPRARD